METIPLGRDASIGWEKHFACFVIFYGRKHLLFHIIIFRDLHMGPSWRFGGNEKSRVRTKKCSVFISPKPEEKFMK